MNERLFHIQRTNSHNEEWSIGKSIKIDGKRLNDFYQGITPGTGRREHLNNEYVGNLKYAEFILNSPESRGNIDLICPLAKTLFYDLQQYLKWVREEIFEKIRILKFPSLPSRKTCLWLCTESSLIHWWNYDQFSPKNTKKVLEVSISQSTKIHITNGKTIGGDTDPIGMIEEMAAEYWSGQNQKDSYQEVLFEGELIIKSVYDSPDLV